MMEDESVQTDEEWWKEQGFIDDLNKRREEESNTSIAYVLDESMSSMIPPRYVPLKITYSVCIVYLFSIYRFVFKFVFV